MSEEQTGNGHAHSLPNPFEPTGRVDAKTEAEPSLSANALIDSLPTVSNPAVPNPAIPSSATDRGAWTTREAVLAAVDLGPSSRAVVERAGRLAAGLGADLTIVHVAEPSAQALPKASGRAEALDGSSPEQAATADGSVAHPSGPQADLEALRRLEPTVRTQARTLIGEPVRALLELSDELKPAYVVVGGGISASLLGDVAERLVRRSPWPVVVVPTPHGLIERWTGRTVASRHLAALLGEARRLLDVAVADQKRLEEARRAHMENQRAWERKAALAASAGDRVLHMQILDKLPEQRTKANALEDELRGQEVHVRTLEAAMKDVRCRVDQLQRQTKFSERRAEREEGKAGMQAILDAIKAIDEDNEVNKS